MEDKDKIETDLCPVDLLVEFFEVCFHTILYTRKVYPDCIFTLKKKYNLPVHVSLYPELNNYISQVLTCIKKLLVSNNLQQVSLWILDSTLHPVENFVFSNIRINQSISLASTINELTQCFRAICLKLSMSDYLLQPIPENSSFKVYIKTKESASCNIFEHPEFEIFPWISEDINNQFKELIPIRSSNTTSLHFELYVEI